MPPDVIARVRHYEVGAAKRAFYGSGQKDDYLGYIDKGVQSTKALDYLDYEATKKRVQAYSTRTA